MPTDKKITMEEIIAQYADNIVTLTEFDDKAFIARHQTKSIHVLLADTLIENDLIYLVRDDKKIKHNLSFLSDKLQEMTFLHLNDLKNAYLDWFVIGTWICLFESQIQNGKKRNGMQPIKYTLDLDLLKKGQYLMVDQNVLTDLKRIQSQLLEMDLEAEMNQYTIKTISV
jgi:hypothetical protein